MSTKLLLKATLVTLLMPGTVVGLVPYLVLRETPLGDAVDFSLVSIIALTAGLVGLTALFSCIRGFAIHGRGTLAPIDPPKVLIVRGLYGYTRNPMYVAVLLTLASETVFFRSISLLMYTTIIFACFHVFVLLYEEPHLRSRFGDSYRDYLKAVPRWGIRFRGYTN